MKPMQDNELDQFFQQKMADAEMMPSSDVWSKIDQKLDQKNNKRKPFVLWIASGGIAAALAIVMYLPRENSIKLYQGQDANLAENTTRTELPPAAVPENNILVNTDAEKVAKRTHTVAHADPYLDKKQNARTQTEVVLVSTPTEVVDPQGPTKSLAETNYSEAIELPTKTATPSRVMFASNEPVIETETKPSIRNIGDLVNLVVEKIDKRDKKLIRFATDDDDNSSLVGINIGFIKLNKKIY